jgi:hypothetical protein
MSIRETIQNKKGTAAAVSAVVVVLSIFLISRNFFSGPQTVTNSVYFTTDDGQTQFSDSMDRLAPFDHGGNPAYRAWVYTTDGGKTKFVAYLERYTPAAKARLESQLADYNSGKTHAPPSVGPADTEVKKPGAGNPWVSRADFQLASKITDVPTPAGGVAEPVLP